MPPCKEFIANLSGSSPDKASICRNTYQSSIVVASDFSRCYDISLHFPKNSCKTHDKWQTVPISVAIKPQIFLLIRHPQTPACPWLLTCNVDLFASGSLRRCRLMVYKEVLQKKKKKKQRNRQLESNRHTWRNFLLATELKLTHGLW
jgi:hypothetical protein